MKKILVVILSLALTACGQTTTAADTTEAVNVEEQVEQLEPYEPDGSYNHPFFLEPREFPGTIEGLEYVKENCHFCYDATYYTDTDHEYIFSRFGNCLDIETANFSSKPVVLEGSHFIVIESIGEVWYINTDRKWASFNYTKHSYAETPKISVSEVYADSVEGFEVEELYFNHAKAKDHRIAVATYDGTLMCYDNGELCLRRYNTIVDQFNLPFPIKELKNEDRYYGISTGCSFIQYSAVLENNTVLTIRVENSELHIHVAHNGTMDEEVRLLVCTEENKISYIMTNNDSVFFYINDELHVSNGEWDVLVDDLPWSKVRTGNIYGPGKDAGVLGRFLSQIEGPDDYDLEEELENTGITY